MIYRIQVSSSAKDKDYKFNLQCYDRDFLSSNELIGEATIKLKKLVNDCKLVKRPMCFDKKYHKDLFDRKEMTELEFVKENPS